MSITKAYKEQKGRKTLKEYLEILKSDRCFCNRKKKEGQPFCPEHYFKLDLEHRNALYSTIGDGFEPAYDRAKDKLLGGRSSRRR